MRTTAFVLSLLAAVLIAGCGAEETVEETAAPGAATPAVDTTPSAGELTASSAPGTATEIAGPLRRGGEFVLSDHRGVPVVVNFFATWCGPCREEIPALSRLEREFGGELVLVGVSVDDDAAALDEFIADQGIDYPVLWLEDLDNKDAVLNDYVFSAIPTTFIVRADRTPGEMIVGSRDEATFRAIFEEYL